MVLWLRHNLGLMKVRYLDAMMLTNLNISSRRGKGIAKSEDVDEKRIAFHYPLKSGQDHWPCFQAPSPGQKLHADSRDELYSGNEKCWVPLELLLQPS